MKLYFNRRRILECDTGKGTGADYSYLWSGHWLAPSDAIWRQRYGSTLVQVMACCLRVPSHYVKQYWLINTKVFWHSSEGIIVRRYEDAFKWNKSEIHFFKVTFRSPRDKWVNAVVARINSAICTTQRTFVYWIGIAIGTQTQCDDNGFLPG